MLGAAVAMSGMLLVGLETDFWWIRVIMFLRGLAMGFCFVASQAASYAEIAPADNGRASAIFSTQRQMAVSIGVALMATVLSSFTTLSAAPSDPDRALVGYHWTFAVCVGLALISAAAGVPPDPRRGRPRDDARQPRRAGRTRGPPATRD